MKARPILRPLLAAAFSTLLFSCSGTIPERETGPDASGQDIDPVTIRVMTSAPLAGETPSATLVQRIGTSDRMGLYNSSGFIRDADGQTLAFTVPDVLPQTGASSYYYSLILPSGAAESSSSHTVFMSVPSEQKPSVKGPDPVASIYAGFAEGVKDTPPTLLEIDVYPLCSTGIITLRGFDPDEGEELVSVTASFPGKQVAGSVTADVFLKEISYESEAELSSVRILTSGLESSPQGFDLYFCCKPFRLEAGERVSLLIETSARSFTSEITVPEAQSFPAGESGSLTCRIEMPLEADPDVPESLSSYSVTGRLWYISPEGSDRNGGTSRSDAVRSFSKAISLLSPGDQLRIMPGTYEASSSDLVRLGKADSGTEGNWISFVADDPDNPPVLHAGGYGVWNAFVVNASYIALDGLVVCGDNQTISFDDAYACAKNYYDTGVFDSKKIAGYSTNGIAVGGSGQNSEWPHHVIVRNCTVHDMPGGGITAIQADYVTIEYNTVYNNAWYSMYGCSGISILTPLSIDAYRGYKMIVRGNSVWNNRTEVPWVRRGVAFERSDGNGIILDVNESAQSGGISPSSGAYTGRTLVENNLSVHNGGSGIHTFKADHIDIVGNTTYYNGWMYPQNNYGEIWNNQSSDVNIYNNIMYARPGGKCNLGTNTPYWNNICYGGSVQYYGNGTKVADPLFVKLSTEREDGDFHLKKGSPAIGYGLTSGTLHLPVGDLEKHSRKSRFDCGAFQFIEGDTDKD